LAHITRGDPKAYLDRLCEQYISDLAHYGRIVALEVIRAHLSKFEALDNKIQPWQATVHKEGGCGKEWREIEEIRAELHQHVLWVGEIECMAEVLPNELVQEYEKQALLYQRALTR
jgi:hypothetical protein